MQRTKKSNQKIIYLFIVSCHRIDYFEVLLYSPCYIVILLGIIKYYLSQDLILVTKTHLFLIQYSTTNILKRYTSHFKKKTTSSKDANHAEVCNACVILIIGSANTVITTERIKKKKYRFMASFFT